MEEYDDDDEEKFIRYAEFYRKRLESKIDEPLSGNGEPRDPPKWLRSARAENLWRNVTGSNPPEDWSVDEIITALVVRAFGRLVCEGEGEGNVDGKGD